MVTDENGRLEGGSYGREVSVIRLPFGAVTCHDTAIDKCLVFTMLLETPLFAFVRCFGICKLCLPILLHLQVKGEGCSAST